MKNLQLRFTNKDDYPELCNWWNWWRWKNSKPSLALLDNLKFGLMVSSEKGNNCAGFLYFTNARAFGLLEFIISNPDIKDKKERKEAQIFLINSLLVLAKKQGIKVVFSSLRNPNLKNTYKECGFEEGSKNTTEMVFRL